MKVVVTGATGFVGEALVAALLARGDHVVVLTRDPSKARRLGDVSAIQAELETPGPWQEHLAADAVVHLAGEPIAGRRWDSRVKQAIRDSRVESARVIVEGIGALPAAQRPRVLISASGIDYYPFASEIGAFDDDDVTERDPAGDEFLARVCKAWEEEAAAASQHGVRVVRLRQGLVLGPGGALTRMTGPFKLFVGGAVGSGRQWVSWIHRDDVVGVILAALDDERYAGPLNLVAPEASRARDVARAIGAAMGRPSWLPVPGFAIKAAVGGEFAQHLLHGRKAIPARLTELGYRFRHPRLAEAVAASVQARPARTSDTAGSGSGATP